VEKSLLCSSSSELIKAIITFKELIEAGMDAAVCATEPTLRADHLFTANKRKILDPCGSVLAWRRRDQEAS